MLRNYFKTTIRNLWRSKSFAAINISGLAIGMAAAMLIFLWIQNEWGTDRFYNNEDRIYQMYNRDKDPDAHVWAWPSTPKVLASTLKKDYPEVEQVTRYSNITFLLSQGDKHLNTQGAFADSNFFNVFSLPLLKGNVQDALKGSYSIVITETLAKKLFGNEDAMGKTVRIDSTNNCTVSAVIKDLPNNTKFTFEYLLPWAYMTKIGWDDDNWVNNSVLTYVMLKSGTLQASFDSKIKNITIEHTKGTASASTTEVFTQPLSRAYLYSKSENGQLVGGPVEAVKLFAVIAAFILLIACINFMNLSTARSEKRAREVGIRKVAGAQRYKIIFQFLAESIILSLFAFIIALMLVQLSLSAFNTLVGKQLFIDYTNPYFWLFAGSFILFSGILAGSYPAFFLSSFNPVKVLKGTFKPAGAAVNPRKVLVVLQFSFSIILIISTIIVQRQIQYALNRDAGYNRNNLIYTFAQGDVLKHYDQIKHELLSSGAAVSVTQCSNPITKRWGDNWGYAWEGSTKADEKIDFIRLGSDADFAKTTGVKIIAGRDIDVYNYSTDSTAVMLNEAAVKAMHLKNPVGLVITETGGNAKYHVVGVVKDFVLESPYEQNISPAMIFGPARNSGYVVHIKLNAANSTGKNLAAVEKILKTYNPQYPFEYVFADESYAKKFSDMQRTGSLAALFAGLTIFISCLGLFALSAYLTESRAKEIGVRKVLGASVFSITSLLSKDFLKLVIVAFVIASPIAWYAMNTWLDNYSYKLNIEWWVFALAGLLAVSIAVCTVSFQAIKAAVANPVKALRTE